MSRGSRMECWRRGGFKLWFFRGICGCGAGGFSLGPPALKRPSGIKLGAPVCVRGPGQDLYRMAA